MDWKQAIKEEKAMLMRIVVLLLSLADLAEHVSRRSRAVCSLLLWILHPAARAAWTFVDDASDELPVPMLRTGDVNEDLVVLAMFFRELAVLLTCQANLAFSTEDRSQIYPLSYGTGCILQIVTALTQLDVARPVLTPDTS